MSVGPSNNSTDKLVLYLILWWNRHQAQTLSKYQFMVMAYNCFRALASASSLSFEIKKNKM